MKTTHMSKKVGEKAQEAYYLASNRQLMWRKFRRHKLALVGGVALGLLYLMAAFGGFVSPYDANQYSDHPFTPPQRIRFVDNEGKFRLRPFVYGIDQRLDMSTLSRVYREDRTQKFFLKLFVRAHEYKLFGLMKTDLHLVGVDTPGSLHFFGTDQMGRDLFSRNVYGAGISLTIGLVGVALSFFLGCLLGGISGFFGGTIDTVIQRIIEFLLSMPQIPLWMALSAALPTHWSPIKTYFGITIVLSIVGWTGLARIVRGRILAIRAVDFALAAKVSGASEGQILFRHLLPSFMSYLIVHLTLAIPRMILGETALSFLGLGIQPPAISWGTLLKDGQDIRSLSLYPWLLIPGLFVIVVVLAFNFLGDGLRDAADPYR